ncbi:MAG: hypothetical protein A3C00_00400 [Candidatus Jacksonbacteria bacterium RIFCSPHIGHO2_02_FULL_44_25]|nr:MAG: hypothetical protein A3C00_00400 [Candidatus Jacksonbacteria bacterium RIFCSPHIGHO2_02_FULL_44_25]OGY71320.1 MAG: hypothetical protein A3E05_00980 [Candidatus Jacksonbacteria bacterium RIFCSPHIGHO2_12_FULL_44_12]OGY74734.1 MAG: hypothetical protein A3H07_02145 [Candidatus Jacksonbacteria bacterium RIFCSPLOWO2_12_FULL_44_15b]
MSIEIFHKKDPVFDEAFNFFRDLSGYLFVALFFVVALPVALVGFLFFMTPVLFFVLPAFFLLGPGIISCKNQFSMSGDFLM